MGTIKDVAETIQAIVTSVGICVAGVWAWLTFVRRRQRYPRARLTHQIQHVPVGGKHAVLHVRATISNEGDVLLCLVEGTAWIAQILPPPSAVLKAIEECRDPVQGQKTEIEWPRISEVRQESWKKHEVEVEPGETEEFHYDFALEPDAKCVQVYTYFRNAKKRRRELGWRLTSWYDVSAGRSIFERGGPNT